MPLGKFRKVTVLPCLQFLNSLPSIQVSTPTTYTVVYIVTELNRIHFIGPPLLPYS